MMIVESLISWYRKNEGLEQSAFIIAVLIAVGVLAIDLTMPLGAAGGVPYVAAVLVTLWASRKLTLGIAVLTSILTTIGYFLSPSSGELWEVLSNRFLALFAIWVTAVLINLRMKAEEELHLFGQKNALHLEQSPLAFVEWNMKFEVTAWNKVATTIFGYPEREALGHHARDLIIPADVAPQVDEIWQDLLAGSGGSSSINENITKDSRRITCEWFNTPLKNENGEVIGMASLVRDITERKQIKESLQESEEKYRGLIQQASDGIFISSPNGALLEVNPAGRAILGYSDEDISGLSIRDFLRIEHQPDDQLHLEDLVIGKGILREYDVIQKDGSMIQVEISAIRMPNNQIQAIVRDITERKRAEEAISESEAKYRNLVETSQDLIWSCDKTGCFTYLNPAWEELLGYSAEEMLGRPFADFKPPQIAKRDQETFKKIIGGSANFGYETIYLTKNGEEKHLVFNARMVKSSTGMLIGSSGTAHDITERKRVEEALRASEENFRNIFHSTPESLLTVDKELNVMKSNKKFGKLIHLYAPRLNMSEDALRTKILSELKKRIGKEKQGLIEIDSVTNS